MRRRLLVGGFEYLQQLLHLPGLSLSAKDLIGGCVCYRVGNFAQIGLKYVKEVVICRPARGAQAKGSFFKRMTTLLIRVLWGHNY